MGRFTQGGGFRGRGRGRGRGGGRGGRGRGGFQQRAQFQQPPSAASDFQAPPPPFQAPQPPFQAPQPPFQAPQPPQFQAPFAAAPAYQQFAPPPPGGPPFYQQQQFAYAQEQPAYYAAPPLPPAPAYGGGGGGGGYSDAVRARQQAYAPVQQPPSYSDAGYGQQQSFQSEGDRGYPPPPSYGEGERYAPQQPPPPPASYPDAPLPPPTRTNEAVKQEAAGYSDERGERGYLKPEQAASPRYPHERDDRGYVPADEQRLPPPSHQQPPPPPPAPPSDDYAPPSYNENPPRQQQQQPWVTDYNSSGYGSNQHRGGRPQRGPRGPPPPTYCCHKCGQPGHWIQECPSGANNYNDRRGGGNGYYQKPNYHQQQQQHQSYPPSYPQGGPPAYGGHQHGYPPLPSSPPRPPLPPRDEPPYPPNVVSPEDNEADWAVRDRVPPMPMHHHPPPLPQGPPPPFESDHHHHYPAYDRSYPPRQHQPPPPQEFNWHCDTCVKSFVMESQYEAHLKTHIKCPEGDCDFSASKRVVGAHFQTAHGQYAGQGLKEIDIEGQKFMVLVGDSPEDIAKWREERRKKWPGPSKKGSATTAPPVVPYPTRKRKLSSSSEELEEGEVAEDEEEPAKADVSVEENESKDAKEESESGTKPTSPQTNAVSTEIHQSSSTSTEPVTKKQKSTALCKKFVRGQCRFGDKCNFSHDRSSFACNAMVIKGRCFKGSSCPFSHDPELLSARSEQRKSSAEQRAVDEKWRAESGSLLRKLLKKDIEVEQRQMLQIVRFIVSNDFFKQDQETQ